MLADFHSHILPAIDDGSSSVAESIRMLQMEAEQGVTHVIATPHFYPQHDSPERFLARRDAAEALLRQEMAKYDGLPSLSVGAEVYYYRGISDSEFLSGLTIGKNHSILIEMPETAWTESMYSELADIYQKQGLTPIVAHVDRYITPLNARRVCGRLAQLPVYVQANAEAFSKGGRCGMMLRLLRKGLIQLLGSDCHNTGSRKPNLSDAVAVVERRLGREAIEFIRNCEQEILQHEYAI